MGSSEENEAAVRACFQTGLDGNLDALDSIIDPESALPNGRDLRPTP